MSHAEDLHFYFKMVEFQKHQVVLDEVDRGHAFGLVHLVGQIEVTSSDFLDKVVEEFAACDDDDDYDDLQCEWAVSCLRILRDYFTSFCEEPDIQEYDAQGHNDVAFKWIRLDEVTIEVEASLAVCWRAPMPATLDGVADVLRSNLNPYTHEHDLGDDIANYILGDFLTEVEPEVSWEVGKMDSEGIIEWDWCTPDEVFYEHPDLHGVIRVEGRQIVEVLNALLDHPVADYISQDGKRFYRP